jgi:hypothetical protein
LTNQSQASILKIGYVGRSRQEKLMSDAEMVKLRTKHPNLHQAVAHGQLMEASGDFVKVAESHPVVKK